VDPITESTELFDGVGPLLSDFVENYLKPTRDAFLDMADALEAGARAIHD